MELQTALVTTDLAPIYTPGWREAQLVLTPCPRMLSSNVVSAGIEPTTPRLWARRLTTVPQKPQKSLNPLENSLIYWKSYRDNVSVKVNTSIRRSLCRALPIDRDLAVKVGLTDFVNLVLLRIRSTVPSGFAAMNEHAMEYQSMWIYMTISGSLEVIHTAYQGYSSKLKCHRKESSFC